jgi:NAD-dependent oxidoreductase involved in siderophore biosynthesis
VFKPGEKVYVFKIDVKDEAVQFFVISGETYDVNVKGSTRQTRYKSLISFQFAKGFLDTAEPAAVKKVVDEVLIPETEAAGANTKSIELGQTLQQVEAALGKPDKVVNLGPKTIYVYKDMKVVFQDGKVADVQ